MCNEQKSPASAIDSEAAKQRHKVVILLGATATGKSSLAMEVAAKTGACIVNCDALQVYRDLEVGTSKPSRADRQQVEHHLFDFVDPAERFSAGEYVALAGPLLERLTRTQPVLLVGGTGLYYRSLTRGIAAIPPISDDVRTRVRSMAAESGTLHCHRELEQVDPVMAASVHPADRQRVLRALEVFFETGVSQAQWIAEQKPPERSWHFTPFWLTLKRSVLYDSISVRTQAMFNSSWMSEVRSLLDAGIPASAPAFQAIGYQQIIEVLTGKISEAEALEQILTATRRYAKRQTTWFRKEPGLTILDGGSRPEASRQLVASVRADGST